jgi:toxin ParE1/3/4
VLKLSIPAAKAIENILHFTFENWGETQFECYFLLIQETFNEIGDNPNCLLCRQRDELFEGCRSRTFGKHVVFYRTKAGDVEVIRVLHQMMDHGAYLR